jgi:hypothetical protein
MADRTLFAEFAPEPLTVCAPEKSSPFESARFIRTRSLWTSGSMAVRTLTVPRAARKRIHGGRLRCRRAASQTSTSGKHTLEIVGTRPTSFVLRRARLRFGPTTTVEEEHSPKARASRARLGELPSVAANQCEPFTEGEDRRESISGPAWARSASAWAFTLSATSIRRLRP